MELEEIQAVWSQLSSELDKQKKLTHQIIMEMTQEKYRNKFGKIATHETMGAVVCYGAAIALMVFFPKLDRWYFLLMGLLALGFLLVVPTLVVRSVYQIRAIDLLRESYKDTLLRFTKARKRLLRTQQWAIYTSMVFVLMSLPLGGKLIDNRDYFREDVDGMLWGSLAVSVVFVYVFSKWAYRHYEKATKEAESLLQDLE